MKKRASEKNGHGTERAGERNERRTNNAGRMGKTSDNKSNRNSRSRGGDRLSSVCLNNVDNYFAGDLYPKNDREKCKFSGGDRLSVFLAKTRVDDKDITFKIMRTDATGSPCFLAFVVLQMCTYITCCC